MDKFPDLISAGSRLAVKIQPYCGSNPIVLGIANGGVPVAMEVAGQLKADLDITLIKRLLTPRGPHDPVCAFSIAGTLVIDDEVSVPIGKPHSPFEYFLDSALKDLSVRASECRDEQPPARLDGREIVVVDNGVQTGATMKAIIRALRKLEPATIVTAVPVVAAEVRPRIARISDQFVSLVSCEKMGHVGLWYTNFSRPSDDQVRLMFKMSRKSRLACTMRSRPADLQTKGSFDE